MTNHDPIRPWSPDETMCAQCGKYHPNAPRCPHCGFERAVKADRSAATDPAKDEPPERRDSPPGLDDVIGNRAAVLQIRTALDAHRARGGKGPLPHVLLAGVGGCGKTMLAEIVAREAGRPIRLQMGQSLNSPARVAEMLLTLKSGDVLFIDEIHGLKRACQETLYRAMEDRVLVPIVASRLAPPLPIKLPAFTLIGATTDEWGLLPSLLQRFKYRVRLERLSSDELASVLFQRAAAKGWAVTEEAARMIAERAHGTPRLALGMLEGCMDTALAGGETSIDRLIVEATCEVWQLDAMGLDRIERRYLASLQAAGGKPVRVNVIASQLDNLSRRTVEIKIEPTLIWCGLIEKRADGRCLTGAGRRHLRGSK